MRLLIARPTSKMGTSQPWEVIAYNHQITRLGQGIHEHGKLSDAGINRTLQALQTFKSIIDSHQITSKQIYATATAAVRESENGYVFQQQVLKNTGIHITIINGKHEASMALLGATAVLHKKPQNDMLFFDIGGGSTEFIRAKQGHIVDSISCKLGVVRLVEAHLHSDPPSLEDYQAIKNTVSTHLQTVEQHWKKTSDTIPAYMVGTAGTVTTLAAVQMDLVPYDPQQVNNHPISRTDFNQLKDHLLSLNHKQRERIPAIEAGRSDLIIAGLAIIETIMEKWDYNFFITVDAGLLEGNWLASYASE